MGRTISRTLTPAAILLSSATFAFAQDVNITVGKPASPVPKACESLSRASVEPNVDIPALAKEAICKGAGEMISDYTYLFKLVKRQSKDAGIKEQITTYEVYAPTLKSGTRASGVLLVTSRNGVPVPPNEMEKARLKAGKDLEEQERRIERESARQPVSRQGDPAAMLPVGSYPNLEIGRGLLRGGVRLRVHTFLRACELKLAGRNRSDGREVLVFSFLPRGDAQLDDSEEWVKQLYGTIWIDAADRIVTKLIGWPIGNDGVDPVSSPDIRQKPPALQVEMSRVPEGVWLMTLIRMNGLDYPSLFRGVSYDSILTYTEYKTFKTEVKDVKLEPPKKQ